MEGGTMSIPVPSLIGSSPSGGRFQFDDGGSYSGGWQDGKAHGHGVCTGPKNVGEYSGSWNFGFEMSGVYKWKNGAIYEGRWQNGKRHGVGVEYNGKWIYKGEWSQGFKGRYGVKASVNSAVKYEGTWANGLQDGYGSETYSDGGYYQGQMCRGLRHGYGVRKSAPYGDSQLNNPARSNVTNGGSSLLVTPVGLAGSAPLIHSNSLQSAQSIDLANNDDDSPKPEDGFKPNIERTVASKNGFVLVARPLEVPIPTSRPEVTRRGSLTGRLASARIPGVNQSPVNLLKRGLRLRKQKSSSDLEHLDTSGGNRNKQHSNDEAPVALPFTLSPEELDITDPTAVETYTGEWKHDKRNGYGVCERSDGLRYEGQWHNDMKSGFGQTTFKDGTKEEGKYKNNILVKDSNIKRLFQFAGGNTREKIDEAVKMAQQAQQMSLKKAEIADARAATARDKAEQATVAAQEADRDSKIAFSVARQYSESQDQLGMALAGAFPGGANFPGANANFMYNPNSNMPDPSMVIPPASSALQTRRVSQFQQQQMIGNRNMGYGNYPPQVGSGADMNSQRLPGFEGQQLDLVQQQQQQQYLNMNVEPFNGRRGSFRGGPTSGGSGSRQSHQLIYGSTNQRQSSSDPFSDLFDHYKSSSQGPSVSRRHPALHKQSSLDNNQRSTSGEPPHLSRTGNLRRLRMNASMDQANPPMFDDSTDRQFSTADNNNGQDMQQQLRHLVTSGEDLQRANELNTHNTPAGSSYILPPSASSSSYYPMNAGQNRTPSPDRWSNNQQHQQVASNYPSRQYPSYIIKSKQRDVHSLADEQLYSSNRRNLFNLEDQTEFANYDFAITSSPRPTRRCMRRTASLSRNTLTSQELRSSSQLLAASKGIQQRNASPAFSITNASPTRIIQPPEQQQQQQHHQRFQSPSSLGATDLPNQHPPGSNSSHLTLDSSTSSTAGLLRKPSLQVRYDPVHLGGLMTREEVAALSHAQREQKRLEAELAEKRAKRPLLHLYLSIKEFVIRQQLILTVIIINAFVFKMFADLIL